MLVSFPGLETVLYGTVRSVSTYPAAHSDHVYTQALTARACNAICNVVSVLSEREVKHPWCAYLCF